MRHIAAVLVVVLMASTAVAQYREAKAYARRGYLSSLEGDYNKAIEHYTEAIRLDPKFVRAYVSRGITWGDIGEIDKAISDYTEASRLDPKNADPIFRLAWTLATNPDAKYRDGKKAVEYAKRACELTRYIEAVDISILAAAYAESGDFKKAVEQQAKAIELADDAKDKTDYLSPLELYKQGKPYRREVKK